MRQHSYLALRRRRNVLLRTMSPDIADKSTDLDCQRANPDARDSRRRPALQKNHASGGSSLLALILPRFVG
ncbi:MAG: hypothetical protein ACI8PP_000682 [Candidatus Pseudothioglobus sp.]|jgi:hypothetical protein